MIGLINQILMPEKIKEEALAKRAGLIPAGMSSDGELEYIGHSDAFDRYEALKEEYGL